MNYSLIGNLLYNFAKNDLFLVLCNPFCFKFIFSFLCYLSYSFECYLTWITFSVQHFFVEKCRSLKKKKTTDCAKYGGWSEYISRSVLVYIHYMRAEDKREVGWILWILYACLRYTITILPGFKFIRRMHSLCIGQT